MRRHVTTLGRLGCGLVLLSAGWVPAWSLPLRLSPPPTDEAIVMPNASAEATANPNPNNATPSIKLKIEKQGASKMLLLQRLKTQHYTLFQKKSEPLAQSLIRAKHYLDTLGRDTPPSLQRLSAYSSDAWLDWKSLESKLNPTEKSYRSYQLMTQAVQELRSMTEYWTLADQLRPMYRGTLREEEIDKQIVQAKTQKIRLALDELEQFEKLKHDLNAELPY